MPEWVLWTGKSPSEAFLIFPLPVDTSESSLQMDTCCAGSLWKHHRLRLRSHCTGRSLLKAQIAPAADVSWQLVKCEPCHRFLVCPLVYVLSFPNGALLTQTHRTIVNLLRSSALREGGCHLCEATSCLAVLWPSLHGAASWPLDPPAAPEQGDHDYSAGTAAKASHWKPATALATPAHELFPLESNLMLGCSKKQNICSTRNPFHELEWTLKEPVEPPSLQSWHETTTWQEAAEFCHRVQETRVHHYWTDSLKVSSRGRTLSCPAVPWLFIYLFLSVWQEQASRGLFRYHLFIIIVMADNRRLMKPKTWCLWG